MSESPSSPSHGSSTKSLRDQLASPDQLPQFRDYLRSLAQGWAGDAQGRIEPSDVVQQTLLEAYSARAEFRGTTRAELAQWLKQMLAHNIADAGRALRRQKRDIARERPLNTVDADASKCAPGNWLASDHTPPSQQVRRAEQLLQLTEAIRQLPEAQCQAVVLHHLQGLSLAEVANRLQKTRPAVAGLLHRGLNSLRSRLAELSDE